MKTPFKIIKTNNLQKGDCILAPQYRVYIDGNKYHAFLYVGNSFDEAVDYFMANWGNKPKYKPMFSIEVMYNLLTKDYLFALSKAC